MPAEGGLKMKSRSHELLNPATRALIASIDIRKEVK